MMLLLMHGDGSGPADPKTRTGVPFSCHATGCYWISHERRLLQKSSSESVTSPGCLALFGLELHGGSSQVLAAVAGVPPVLEAKPSVRLPACCLRASRCAGVVKCKRRQAPAPSFLRAQPWLLPVCRVQERRAAKSALEGAGFAVGGCSQGRVARHLGARGRAARLHTTCGVGFEV